MLSAMVGAVFRTAYLSVESTAPAAASLPMVSALLSGEKKPALLQGDVQVRTKKTFTKKTMSRRFPGHIDLYDEEGKRECLYKAVERYKRLDWGMYITTKPLRLQKKWKRTPYENWYREQHCFVKEELDNLKLERMFLHDTKLPRFIPDDPYEKYNRMSWAKHHWTMLKNAELVRRYGNKDHHYNRYVAHLRFRGKEVVKTKLHYMPPDYLKTIECNPQGEYRPGHEAAPPSKETPPHFQRERIKGKLDKHFKYLKNIRKMEKHCDKPAKLWSPLIMPSVYRT